MPSAGATATASGLRSVAVAGDVTNSVIVTGDDVTVQLRVDGDDALLARLLGDAGAPVRRPRPAPVHDVPPPSPEHLDREAEVAALLAALRDGRPVELSGEADVGKTLVVLRALDDPGARVHAAGEVYVRASGKRLRDVLQDVFDALVETTPAAVLSEQALRRELRDVRALVAVDGHALDRDELRALRHALPAARLVVAARPRVLGEGAHVAVAGLHGPDALALLEQELGRPLREDERPAAAQVCAALHGHPFRLRQAAASVREGGRTLAALAGDLAGGRPLTALVLEALTPEEADVVRALAAVRGETVGIAHMVALLGREGLAERVEALRRRRVLATGSPRFRVAGATLEAQARPDDVAAALAHFTAWARARRGTPAEVLGEAPALLALLERAAEEGRPQEAIALGRSMDAALAWGRRWGAWEAVLARVRALAADAGDAHAEAWALHQLGTRAYALGDAEAGVALLERALALRERIGDRAGAEATRHNLGFIADPPAEDEDGDGDGGDGPGGGRHLGRAALAGALAVVAALVAAFVATGGDDPPSPPPDRIVRTAPAPTREAPGSPAPAPGTPGTAEGITTVEPPSRTDPKTTPVEPPDEDAPPGKDPPGTDPPTTGEDPIVIDRVPVTPTRPPPVLEQEPQGPAPITKDGGTSTTPSDVPR